MKKIMAFVLVTAVALSISTVSVFAQGKGGNLPIFKTWCVTQNAENVNNNCKSRNGCFFADANADEVCDNKGERVGRGRGQGRGGNCSLFIDENEDSFCDN